MTTSSFQSLEEAITDEHFPDVDLALRRGRHVGRDDGTTYDYLVDALDHLEPFYRRFGCELMQRADGYFYLLPSGDRLGRRQLSAGEMLVGQTLALMYLDPATLQQGGMVQRETLFQRLSGLLGTETLVRTLNPRRRKFDEEALSADFGERSLEPEVSLRSHRNQFGAQSVMQARKAQGDVLGLPSGEQAAARRDANPLHGRDYRPKRP